MQGTPGTRTLSQKLLLSIVSIDTILLKLSSVVGFAIVGGKVEISATGPISLSKWNSLSGSFPAKPLVREELYPIVPTPASPLVQDSVG